MPKDEQARDEYSQVTNLCLVQLFKSWDIEISNCFCIPMRVFDWLFKLEALERLYRSTDLIFLL